MTIPTSGETTISASSVAVTPSGTTGITFMLYTMNDVALSSFTIDDTLLEEVATAVGPGPYFDGSFADTPTANYEWDGEPDYSASTIYEPSDPDDYAMVAVEALIDGVVVATTEGSITEGEISVSIDECREGNMTWRVRSLDADPTRLPPRRGHSPRKAPSWRQARPRWRRWRVQRTTAHRPGWCDSGRQREAVWPHPATGDSRLWADGHRAVRLARGRHGEGRVHPRRGTPLRLQR